MERATSIIRAKEIMGNNFIGPNEIIPIANKLGIKIPDNIREILPQIQFSEELFENLKDDYILILGIPTYKDGSVLTLVKMREHFGWNPEKYEPCFYNQDWYLNETFANEVTFEDKWYLIKKNVLDKYRGVSPENIDKQFSSDLILPTAILCTYTFFSYYFFTEGQKLWENDFIWCSDSDSNGDQIYVGRYNDVNGLNKSGFNIHRHLSIKNNFSFINVLV